MASFLNRGHFANFLIYSTGAILNISETKKLDVDLCLFTKSSNTSKYKIVPNAKGGFQHSFSYNPFGDDVAYLPKFASFFSKQVPNDDEKFRRHI